jgi:hypothetical protein
MCCFDAIDNSRTHYWRSFPLYYKTACSCCYASMSSISDVCGQFLIVFGPGGGAVEPAGGRREPVAIMPLPPAHSLERLRKTFLLDVDAGRSSTMSVPNLAYNIRRFVTLTPAPLGSIPSRTRIRPSAAAALNQTFGGDNGKLQIAPWPDRPSAAEAVGVTLCNK